MSEFMNILLVGVGIPALGLTIIFTTLILKSWWVKSKELKIKEEQMRLEMRLKQDHANQLIIESHGNTLSAIEIESVLKEIKNLREELTRTKADIAAMKGIDLTSQANVPDRDMQRD